MKLHYSQVESDPFFFNEFMYPVVFFIPVEPSLSSCIHNCITSIHNVLGQNWCTLYFSLFDPSSQRFHLQISGRRNLNRGICHTPIFDSRPYVHMSFDPEQSLTFQWKFQQRGILKYLIFGSDSSLLHTFIIISPFNIFLFHFHLLFILLLSIILVYFIVLKFLVYSYLSLFTSFYY